MDDNQDLRHDGETVLCTWFIVVAVVTGLSGRLDGDDAVFHWSY